MNAIDLIIIVILALATLFGMYRGFIQSVLNLGSGLLSVVGSFLLFPSVSNVVSTNTAVTRFISTYTDSRSLLGDLDLSSRAVNALSEGSITQIIEKAGLPAPLDTLLAHNLSQKVFSPLGDLATTVGDYVNQTVISVSINVLCFLLCFLACFIVTTVLVNMLRTVFKFPVLKQLDWLVGGGFGLLLGVLLCFVIFTVLPLVESVVPIEQFAQMVDESTLAPLFANGNMIITIMNRRL